MWKNKPRIFVWKNKQEKIVEEQATKGFVDSQNEIDFVENKQQSGCGFPDVRNKRRIVHLLTNKSEFPKEWNLDGGPPIKVSPKKPLKNKRKRPKVQKSLRRMPKNDGQQLRLCSLPNHYR
jgi:hypothetical protein